MPGRASPRRRPLQRGQATTEFVVLALVLVPLVLLVPLAGKYIDLMQTAEQASRYVAFEGAVRNTANAWKSDAELAAEVRRRFFSNSDASVKTGDVAGDFAAHRNGLWSDHKGRPLIDRIDQQVGVQTQVRGMNPLPAAFGSQVFDLPRENLYTGTVTVHPVDVKGLAPFDELGLRISRKTVLLTDAWTARGPAQVRETIEGSWLAYPIGKLKGLIDLAGAAPKLVFDPALKVGDFDWDVVPCDRLIGGC